MSDFPKIQASNIRDDFWANLADYEYTEDYLMGLVEGQQAPTVLQIEDHFGWDFVYKLNDGTLVLGDRNSGEPSVLTEVQFAELLKLVE